MELIVKFGDVNDIFLAVGSLTGDDVSFSYNGSTAEVTIQVENKEEAKELNSRIRLYDLNEDYTCTIVEDGIVQEVLGYF